MPMAKKKKKATNKNKHSLKIDLKNKTLEANGFGLVGVLVCAVPSNAVAMADLIHKFF